MQNQSIYTQIITSRDGFQLPVKDSITFHSKYSPVREAENFAAQFEEKGFFVILGLCGGYHIASLLKKFPDSKIIAVEQNQDDINFLMQIQCNKELKSSSSVIFSTMAELKEKLISNYLPAIHGNLYAKALRQWELCFPEAAQTIKEIINSSIKIISADFSVQKHFGKIWQRNILSNLSLCNSAKSFQDFTKDFDASKTAAIIAAGPTLNDSVKKLKAFREKFFIISTDTAYGSLEKNEIIPDIVISIDGQLVSHSHFMAKSNSKTKFVFDLCSNPAAVRKIINENRSFIFSENGHPLSFYASHFENRTNFIHLNTGSGTVTMAAISLAVQTGFRKLELFGADFSYINGQPYAKGTYLDSNFRINESRLKPAEMKFINLMFRTPVTKLNENTVTTEILNSYRESLSDYLRENFIKYNSEGSLEVPETIKKYLPDSIFNIKSFTETYRKELNDCFNSKDFSGNNRVFQTLLPLAAALDSSPFLAYHKTLSYTYII